MRLEKHYDPEIGAKVDRLVVESQKEEFEAEHLFMIGAGVNCRSTARDYEDPLQRPNKEYPITFAADATATIFRGLHKIMNGPEMGFHGTKPHNARSMLAEMVLERTSVIPLAMVETELESAYAEALKRYPELQVANLN